MRNIIGITAAALMFIGVFMLIMFCGMLDNPNAPIGPAVLMGIAALSVSGAGTALANIFERGRKSV